MKRNLPILFLLLFIFQLGYAQERPITGTVSDSQGMPIPGVNVTVKNAPNRGAQTDFDGNFTINAAANEVLVFSFVGLTRVERTVGTATVINVTMQEDSESLDEVVVVGYGVQAKRDVTGSISQVKGDEIANLVTPSFEAQLAGRAAGVQVTTQSGIIGETPRFRIRGIASITSGTYPLIVVDGIPIYTGDLGGYASNNALGDINPTDIESIEILKDGSATAIYGSRAANGVVLITTKTGREGRMTINANTSVGFASPISKFDLLGTPDFITISNEKRANRNATPWAAGTEFNTDWQDAVLKSNALQQDHNTSFSGGTARTKYYLSLGYSSQESVARPNDMERYSFRSNIDQKIKDWLSVGVNAGLTRTEYNGLNTGTNSLSGNIFNATRQHPNVPIYNADHPSGYNIGYRGTDGNWLSENLVGPWDNLALIGDNLPNIMYAIENNNYYSKINRIISNVYADVKPIESVNFRTQVSVDQANTTGFLYWSPVHGDGQSTNGRVQNNNTDLTRWNWQNILSYNNTFAEAHTVGLTLINEFQKQRNQSFFGTGTDLSDTFFNKNLISNSYGIPGSGGGLTENGFISYAGRFNYNYANRYYLQATLRRDGLSSLPEANRWGTFPGVSVGWTVSEEAFMDGATIVNDFKIRGSYGKVGNVSIGNYPYLGLYGAAKYGDTNGIGYAQFGNNNLRWETSTKYDVGFDLRMFNNRFTFNFDYFLNETDDLILDLETPMSLGIPNNSYSSNIGAIKNSGVELAAEARIIQTQDFTWNLNANISFVDNEVISLVNGQDRIAANNFTITREGEPINSLYGFRYWGVNPANGNPVYYKADGSLVQGMLPGGSYTTFDAANPGAAGTAASLSAAADRTLLGQTLPKYFGGLSSSMAYKGFDFGFLFRFSGGNKIFNATRRDLLNMNFTNNSTEILGRWQSAENPGDGWTPRLYWGTNTTTNLSSSAYTRFVEDADFIKLDNITLGYTLPSEVSQRIGMSKFRVYAQAQNVWIITDYSGADPEMEIAGVDLNLTPRSSIVSFGLNIGL
ncbi:MAG: TonB-dependent receptor [Gillisia sp.]